RRAGGDARLRPVRRRASSTRGRTAARRPGAATEAARRGRRRRRARPGLGAARSGATRGAPRAAARASGHARLRILKGAGMRFGLFYEHQLPRPWDPDSERRIMAAALEQTELADP